MTKKDDRANGLPNAEYLTVAELAGHVGVSRMTIYRLIDSGELDSLRIGRSFRIHRDSWADYLRDC